MMLRLNVRPILKEGSPTHPPNDFLAHEAECRDVLRPLLERLLGMAVSAGWSRRTAASTLMFPTAQQVSAAGPGEDRKP